MVPPARLGTFARLEPMPRGHLDAAPLVDRGVLDEGNEAARHEAAGAIDQQGKDEPAVVAREERQP